MNVAPKLQWQLACRSDLLHIVADEEEGVCAALLLQVRDAAAGEDGELLAVIPAGNVSDVSNGCVGGCSCGEKCLYLPPTLAAMTRWCTCRCSRRSHGSSCSIACSSGSRLPFDAAAVMQDERKAL